MKEFANRKHPEALLRNKKSIGSKDFSQILKKYLKNLCINEAIIVCLKTILFMTCNFVSDKNFLLPMP